MHDLHDLVRVLASWCVDGYTVVTGGDRYMEELNVTQLSSERFSQRTGLVAALRAQISDVPRRI